MGETDTAARAEPLTIISMGEIRLAAGLGVVPPGETLEEQVHSCGAAATALGMGDAYESVVAAYQPNGSLDPDLINRRAELRGALWRHFLGEATKVTLGERRRIGNLAAAHLLDMQEKTTQRRIQLAKEEKAAAAQLAADHIAALKENKERTLAEEARLKAEKAEQNRLAKERAERDKQVSTFINWAISKAAKAKQAQLAKQKRQEALEARQAAVEEAARVKAQARARLTEETARVRAEKAEQVRADKERAARDKKVRAFIDKAITSAAKAERARQAAEDRQNALADRLRAAAETAKAKEQARAERAAEKARANQEAAEAKRRATEQARADRLELRRRELEQAALDRAKEAADQLERTRMAVEAIEADRRTRFQSHASRLLVAVAGLASDLSGLAQDKKIKDLLVEKQLLVHYDELITHMSQEELAAFDPDLTADFLGRVSAQYDSRVSATETPDTLIQDSLRNQMHVRRIRVRSDAALLALLQINLNAEGSDINDSVDMMQLCLALTDMSKDEFFALAQVDRDEVMSVSAGRLARVLVAKDVGEALEEWQATAAVEVPTASESEIELDLDIVAERLLNAMGVPEKRDLFAVALSRDGFILTADQVRLLHSMGASLLQDGSYADLYGVTPEQAKVLSRFFGTGRDQAGRLVHVPPVSFARLSTGVIRSLAQQNATALLSGLGQITRALEEINATPRQEDIDATEAILDGDDPESKIVHEGLVIDGQEAGDGEDGEGESSATAPKDTQDQVDANEQFARADVQEEEDEAAEKVHPEDLDDMPEDKSEDKDPEDDEAPEEILVVDLAPEELDDLRLRSDEADAVVADEAKVDDVKLSFEQLSKELGVDIRPEQAPKAEPRAKVESDILERVAEFFASPVGYDQPLPKEIRVQCTTLFTLYAMTVLTPRDRDMLRHLLGVNLETYRLAAKSAQRQMEPKNVMQLYNVSLAYKLGLDYDPLVAYITDLIRRLVEKHSEAA